MSYFIFRFNVCLTLNVIIFMILNHVCNCRLFVIIISMFRLSKKKMHVFRSFRVRSVISTSKRQHMVKYWLSGGGVEFLFFFISHNHHWHRSHSNDFLTYHENLWIFHSFLFTIQKSNTINMYRIWLTVMVVINVVIYEQAKLEWYIEISGLTY